MFIGRFDRIATLLPPPMCLDAPVAPLPAAWECDLSDDSLRWSAGVYDLFGIARGTRLDRREIVGMYAAESAVLLDRLRSDALARRGSFTFEARVRRADGAWRWMRLTADVIARDGYATRLYGHKRDVTDEMTAGPIRP